jgi:hypothetical protein
MTNHPNKRTLLTAYRVPGFRTQARVDSYDDNHPAFVITLNRRSKKRCAAAVEKSITASMTGAGTEHGISIVGIAKSISTLKCAVWTAKGVAA